MSAAARPPRVTVGVPVFNGARYLRRALGSLVSQDFTDLEIVISDNGSTDPTPAICRAFADADARVRYLREDVNRGAAWNYNRLVDEAVGEFFTWAADDDEYDPRFISACVALLEANPTAVLATTGVEQIDPEGRSLGHVDERFAVQARDPIDRFAALTTYLGGCYQVFGVVRTEALRRTGRIGPYAESDRVLLAELALHGTFLEHPERLFRHREHAQRSIYTHADPRQLNAWFDTRPSDLSRAFSMPAWRIGSGLANAISRAELSRPDRLRAYRVLGSWVLRNGRRLLRNIPGVPLALFRHLRGKRGRAIAGKVTS